mgnify:CR=1 FL=1
MHYLYNLTRPLHWVIHFILVSKALAQPDTNLKKSLEGYIKIKNEKPAGQGWKNLLLSPADWKYEPSYWKFDHGTCLGEMGKEKEHHYAFTKADYSDFELSVYIKMVGEEDANSGVCIRINPTNFDNAPGYQIDMGKGYWASLWEERRGNMIQKFPEELATKLVNQNDWNHYFIVAHGHHIQAWLNGVKTIDIVHENGFANGKIGFQLCHLHNQTKVDVKSLYLRIMKNNPK